MPSVRKKLWNIVPTVLVDAVLLMATVLEVSQNTFCEGDACFGYKKRSD